MTTALPCTHLQIEHFARVCILTNDAGARTGYMLEMRMACKACSKPFQFLGLEPGIDLQGARVSVDGLELNIALAPEGEQPSPLDRLIVNLTPREQRH